MPEEVTPNSSYGSVQHANIDSRLLKKFMGQPGFVQSLTSEQYGGISKRIKTAHWSQNERIVYDAVTDGYTSLDTLPVATGLTTTQVRSAITSLTKKGNLTNLVVVAQPVKM